jgi:hypothetical protein
MNNNAERINGWAAMLGVIRRLRNHRTNHSRYLVNTEELLASSLVSVRHRSFSE